MLEWLAANAATIIVCAVLIVLVAMAIRQIIKAKKREAAPAAMDVAAAGALV